MIAFKAELKDHVTHYLFEHTNRSPIVIPVIMLLVEVVVATTAIRAVKQQVNKEAKAKTADEIAA
ncbi:MAG: hypothetical protein WDN66_02115 [Candidatus Saccharibacteria bacterium]